MYTNPRKGLGDERKPFRSGSDPVTFNPAADAYVDSANPSASYGKSRQIRIDGSPVVRSYLRFNVTGLTGAVAKATLRVYANSSARTGGQARGVANNT